jgi:flagellar biosynthetic protein FlhB
MAEKPATERTEEPTPRRLAKAKEKGQTPRSEELMSFISILILVAATAFSAPYLMRWFTELMMEGMSGQTQPFTDTSHFINFINKKIIDFIFILCPIFLALCVGSVAGGIIVSGLNFSTGALSPKFDTLNPVAGFGKLVNGRSAVKLLTSIAKLLFVTLIVWFYLEDKLEELTTLRWAWSLGMLALIAKMVLGLCIRICIALLVIGAADTIYQKRKFTHDLKMTKQEVKEERKQTEGSPEVRSRIRRIQFEMAAKRMLQEVPKANVVLVNPTHVAVALRYDAKTMEAPIMVAKGADHLSEKIKEIARAYGVPIVRKPELARTIYSTVELGAAIPETLYVAVAEVLALIYRLRHRKV